jgi:hypothetical protein
MTRVPRFLDETIEKAKDYSPKSFGSHKPSMQTHMGSLKGSHDILIRYENAT